MVEGLQEFISKYNVEERYGGLILYKVVLKNYAPWCLGDSISVPPGLGLLDDALAFLQKRYKGVYREGAMVTCRQYNMNRMKLCGEGLHVGTLDCAKWFWESTDRVMECLVMPEDVVCVPYYSIAILEIPWGKFPSDSWIYNIGAVNQKIRCKRLQVLRDITISLEDYDL